MNCTAISSGMLCTNGTAAAYPPRIRKPITVIRVFPSLTPRFRRNKKRAKHGRRNKQSVDYARFNAARPDILCDLLSEGKRRRKYDGFTRMHNTDETSSSLFL